MKQKIQQVGPHQHLYRDDRTGIAWVEDGSTGTGHSAHPNIDGSGSVRGMKKAGIWDQDARTVRSHGFIYNIDVSIVTDELDAIAATHCQCGGRHPLHLAQPRAAQRDDQRAYTYRCPACNALPGARCTEATDIGRKKVPYIHYARTDLVDNPEESKQWLT